MSLRMATTWLPASSHNRHRLLRRLLEKTSTFVRKTWTFDNSWSINTHEFEMILKMCAVVESNSLGVWTNRCCAGESKQLETCTEHRWQHLNMSELSESPKHEHHATIKSTWLAHQTLHVYLRLSCVADHFVFLGSLSMASGKGNTCK